MAGFPSLPLFVREYLVDTTHLTLEESGAYLHLLMHAWVRRGSLPDDDRVLATFCKVSLKKWRRLRPALAPFFTVADGAWTNERLSREWQYVETISEKKRAAGAKGGKARTHKNQGDTEAPAKQNSSGAQAPTPTPTPTPPLREVPPSADAPSASPPEPDPAPLDDDPATRLWREGVPLLTTMLGKSDPAARQFLGRCLKSAGDDHDGVLRIIREASTRSFADPAAWISKACKTKAAGHERQQKRSGNTSWFEAGRRVLERQQRLEEGGRDAGREPADTDDDAGGGGTFARGHSRDDVKPTISPVGDDGSHQVFEHVGKDAGYRPGSLARDRFGDILRVPDRRGSFYH